MANKTITQKDAISLLHQLKPSGVSNSGGKVKAPAPSKANLSPVKINRDLTTEEAVGLLNGTVPKVTPVTAKAPAVDRDARDIAVRQAFKAKNITVPALVATKAKPLAPIKSRLTEGGLGYTPEENQAYAERIQDFGNRMSNVGQSIKHTTVGSIPVAVDTVKQQYANAQVDKANMPSLIEKNNLYNKLVAQRGAIKRTVKEGKYKTEADAAKAFGFDTIDVLEVKIAEAKKALYDAQDHTPVSKDTFGMQQLTKAAEHRQRAVEGLTGADAFLVNSVADIGNAVPAMAVGALNPAAGAAVFMGQATGQKAYELNMKGADPGEAIQRGIVSGVIEGATERLPLDHLAKIVRGATGKSLIVNTLKQSGIEGTEEGISYIANYVADKAANDPDAEFSLKDLAMTAVGGAVSGLFFGAAGSSVNSVVGGVKAPKAKAADPVTEAMSQSSDPAMRTTAEVQKANPDSVVATPDAEALIAEGVKPTEAVNITRNVATVTEGAEGLSNKQIEAILKDPKAVALFEAKSGIKLSTSKAEARNQIKAYHAQTAEAKTVEAEPFTAEAVVEPIPEQTVEPTTDVPAWTQNDPLLTEKYNKLVDEGITPEKAEALLREYDAEVERLGRAPRFAPFDENNRNTAVETFAQESNELLKDLGVAGIEVYYAPRRTDPETSKVIKEKGLYDRSRNVIRLNGSNLKGQDAPAAIVAHELVHKAATKDADIVNRIISTYSAGKAITLDARYRDYAMTYNGFVPGVDGETLGAMTPEQVAAMLTEEQKAYLNEEIAADLMMQALGTKKQMTQFAKSGGRSVLEQVKLIIDRILSALGNGNAKLRVAYSNMLRDLNEVLKSTKEVEAGDGVRASVEATEVDSEGNELSAEQVEFFKDSKVRDENGNLLVVYHGADGVTFDIDSKNKKLIWKTPFNVFDTDKKIEHGAWFSPNRTTAATYGTPVPFYLNITNPIRNESPISEAPTEHDGIYRTSSRNSEIFHADEIAVFSPEQIKSVDNKNPTDDPDIRYSIESVEAKLTKTQADLKAAERKAEKLEAKTEKLKSELKPSGGIRVDTDKTKRLTTELLRRYKSGYDVIETQARIQDLYEGIFEDRYAEDEIRETTLALAKDIISTSNVKEDMLPEYKPVREYLRKTKLRVPEDLQSELDSVGGYSAFRKSNMGRLNLSGKEGLPVDVAYQELSTDYPGLFDEKKYSHPADQLIHMSEVVEQLRPQGYDSAFFDREMEIQNLAAEIDDQYVYSITDRKTQADKIEEKVRAEYEEMTFDKWLAERLKDNKANLVRDIVEQHAPGRMNKVDGKYVYLTTKEVRALTNYLAKAQADLTGLQEEVQVVKVESAKKVERVKKEAKVEADWTEAETKLLDEWQTAKLQHAEKVKRDNLTARFEARLEKEHERHQEVLARQKVRDAKRIERREAEIDELKRKRRLNTVKGRDAQKTFRRYITERNKEKAVEAAGEKFISNLPKTEADKKFDERLAEMKKQIHPWWTQGRRWFENRIQAIDNWSAREVVPIVSAMAKRVQTSASTVDHIFRKSLTTPSGDFIGESFVEVIHIKNSKGEIDTEAMSLYHKYLYLKHTVDRMSFVNRARDKVEAFETEHPEIAALEGEGLADAITSREKTEEAKEQKKLVEEYLYLLKNLATAKNKAVLAYEYTDAEGKRVEVTAEEAQAEAEALEEANPWLIEKSEALYTWWDKFMREWAVGVQITAGDYARWKEMYPHYVPTFRADKDISVAGGAVFRGVVSTSKVFKPAKGSTTDLRRVDDNFANVIQRVVKQRNMSDICTWMMDEAYHDPDAFGDQMLIADPLEELGTDVGLDFDDQTDAGDKMLTDEKNGLYKLTTWRDGEKLTAYISKELYLAFSSLTNAGRIKGLETAIEIGKKATAPTKAAITGYNPSFMLRNPIRDFPTAIINSVVGLRFPIYYAKAWKEMVHRSDEWQRFVALGGTYANFYNQNRGFEANTKMDKPFPLRMLSLTNESTEGVTRFAEYLATIEKFGDTDEARYLGIKNAAEVTVDFSRMGEAERLFNAWIPYRNPAIQGISRTLRLVFGGQQSTVKKRFAHAGVALTRASLVVLLPEIILHSLFAVLGGEDEWRKLTDRVRGSNYCYPTWWFTGREEDKGKFIRIPKSREWGTLIGTPFMLLMDKQAGRKDPFDNYFEEVFKANWSIPFVPIGVDEAVSLLVNKNFAGATIVPSQYQGIDPKEQWNDKTSNLAKGIGQLINFSPMQADYIVSSLFGNLGTFFMQATGNPGQEISKEKPVDVLSQNFGNLMRPFSADNAFSNITTSEFYDAWEKSVAEYKVVKLRQENPEASREYQTKYVMDKYYESLSDISKEIRDLALVQMSKKERDAKVRALRQSMNAIAAEAMGVYEDIQNGKIKEPKLELQYREANLTDRVAKELIKLDAVEGYNFKPVKIGKKFTDPNRTGYEYELTDAQRVEYDTLYSQLYNETMEKVISSSRYQNADAEKRAKLLQDARDGVGSRPGIGDQARRQYAKYLKEQGIKSTKK